MKRSQRRVSEAVGLLGDTNKLEGAVCEPARKLETVTMLSVIRFVPLK